MPSARHASDLWRCARLASVEAMRSTDRTVLTACFSPRVRAHADLARCCRWLIWGCVLLAVGCSDSRRFGLPPLNDASVAADAEPDVATSLPDAGEEPSALLITHLAPGSGPFTGGNTVVVRGAGFDEDAEVRIGGRLAQPADYVLIDSHRLQILVPPGDVGVADVSITQGTDTFTLDDGYVYNAIVVEPANGSVAGGTLVEIVGSSTQFEAGTTVTFDDLACTDVKIVSPTRLTCRTPARRAGEVDVAVTLPGELSLPIVARGAFTYEETGQTYGGGLSGGPIQGTINLTVVDSFLGMVVGGAFAIVGSDLSTEYQGLTNEAGQITFSGEGLLGPVTIHVAKKCFENGSIVAFDAENVTVFLRPLLDPSCGEPGQGGGGQGRLGAFISGELIFPGAEEFGVNTWDDLPEPRSDEERVTYVYTTRAAVDQGNPSPSTGGGTWRITEGSAVVGERGFPYRIFARPAAVAVYALAGLENRTTQRFMPYLMGVARGVIAAPGEEVQGADIFMNIPLDRELQVEMSDLPSATPQGPTEFRVAANLDLGGEGFIVRQINGQLFDAIRRLTSGTLFRLLAQPALVGNLSDARYAITAGWYTGPSDDAPHTALSLNGVNQTDDVIVLNGFLGIPQSPTPPMGSTIPSDRILRWTADGATPDFHLVTIIGGDGNPAWRQIVPGDVRQVEVPDFSSIEELADIPEGFIFWNVRAAKVPDFDFNRMTYNQLAARFWTHDALHSFVMQR